MKRETIKIVGKTGGGTGIAIPNDLPRIRIYESKKNKWNKGQATVSFNKKADRNFGSEFVGFEIDKKTYELLIIPKDKKEIGVCTLHKSNEVDTARKVQSVPLQEWINKLEKVGVKYPLEKWIEPEIDQDGIFVIKPIK